MLNFKFNPTIQTTRTSLLTLFLLLLVLVGLQHPAARLTVERSVGQALAWAAPLPKLPQEVAPQPVTAKVGPAKAKQTLTQHLAQKYRQPLNVVSQAVSAAYVYGEKHAISPLLLLAIMEQESSFRVTARSAYGAVGLMQVVPRFHLEKLKTDDPDKELASPASNVRVGSAIVAEYLDKERGNLPRALARYSGKATSYHEKVARNQRKLEALLANAASPRPRMS